MTSRSIESIYADCSKMVYWTAYSVVRSESDAMDISQNAFLRAMKHIKKIESMGDAQLKGWMYRVTVNLCMDLKRKQKREIPVEEFNEQAESTVFDLPEPAMISKEQRERVRFAIDKLPEIYREAVLLHYFSNLGYDEIARLGNTTEGTIKSRMFRAKQRLYAALKEGENNA